MSHWKSAKGDFVKKSVVLFAAVLLSMQHAMPVVKPTPEKKARVVAASKPLKIKPKPVRVEHPRTIAQRATRSQWRSLTQWKCLDKLWTKESHFNPKARNKRSGAYGIAQFMPQTWENYGVKKTSDPKLQIKYGLRYIYKRYGSPCAAWNHSKRHGWY